MKLNFLKTTFAASLMVVALSTASCKNKGENDNQEIDTLEGVSEIPDETPYDTIVKDNDTLVKKDNSENEFDVTTQVP